MAAVAAGQPIVQPAAQVGTYEALKGIWNESATWKKVAIVVAAVALVIIIAVPNPVGAAIVGASAIAFGVKAGALAVGHFFTVTIPAFFHTAAGAGVIKGSIAMTALSGAGYGVHKGIQDYKARHAAAPVAAAQPDQRAPHEAALARGHELGAEAIRNAAAAAAAAAADAARAAAAAAPAPAAAQPADREAGVFARLRAQLPEMRLGWNWAAPGE